MNAHDNRTMKYSIQIETKHQLACKILHQCIVLANSRTEMLARKK